jgi:hypothetical protein
MFVATLLLLVAAPAPVAAATPPKTRVTRTTRARTVRVRRAPVTKVNLNRVKTVIATVNPPDCTLTPLALGCAERDNARFRVAADSETSAMQGVLPDEKWRRCGLMGAPVCPGKGTTIIKTGDEPTVPPTN